ncbi:hypothetical protein C671_3496 [[Clostridium] bifermentans ATCC 19299]|uniref:hypothetical protein n=1 Tax=Paraclostridium bifermentans TaxID=1490 RepID=UPI00038D39CF|nr:hypothetical protein [Paraclostridium bifermentans]EQK37972.1 hypothetical protein C671_3496 [[Clostridium] bifermentans ATCC 19299] [Paraclostridium bifermentans ATCC 19299]
MLLKDAIKEFLLELDIRGYSNCLKIFSKYMCDSTKLDNIKAINIKEFAKFNKGRGLKIINRNNISEFYQDM